MAGQALLEALQYRLRDQHLLLVADNFEHVLAGAPVIAALLAACPRLKVLVTSRVPLGVYGEHEVYVPPLGLPDPRASDTRTTARTEAVRLFVDRARAARADFTLDPAMTRTVGELCVRLDGLPLAIELAAARVKALGLQQLTALLDDGFRLLVRSHRTAVPRQQTLCATVEWSYDLLTEQERRLFERVAVFAGGWTLEAAEAVGVADIIEAADVLELLAHRVDQSLVVAEDGLGGRARYRLLETLRECGWECLAKSGGAEASQRRHATYFLALASQAEPELRGAEQGVWLARLEQEHDNLRAALHWTMARGEAELGLRLAGALWRFWWVRGHLSEGRQWLEKVLLVAESGGAAQAAVAEVLNGAGTLAFEQGDYSQATTLLEQSLALSRALADRQGIARSLISLGAVARDQGNYSRATTLLEEGLALSRAVDDKWEIARSLHILARLACEGQDDYNRAATLLEQSLALSRALGDTRGIAWVLVSLGATAIDEGDYSRAGALLKEGLAPFQDAGDRPGMAQGLEQLAALACAQDQPERTARLCGAAHALREAIGAPLAPPDQAAYERRVAAVRAGLGEGAFATA